MANLVNYFNSGALYENTGHVTYLTSKLSDKKLYQPTPPVSVFQKYPLQGHKFSDYEKFWSPTELMKKKAHLTPPSPVWGMG